eukprot:COSAG05_NODE_607_length_8381_cov_9.782057_2_plen_209_part_00
MMRALEPLSPGGGLSSKSRLRGKWRKLFHSGAPPLTAIEGGAVVGSNNHARCMAEARLGCPWAKPGRFAPLRPPRKARLSHMTHPPRQVEGATEWSRRGCRSNGQARTPGTEVALDLPRRANAATHAPPRRAGGAAARARAPAPARARAAEAAVARVRAPAPAPAPAPARARRRDLRRITSFSLLDSPMASITRRFTVCLRSSANCWR